MDVLIERSVMLEGMPAQHAAPLTVQHSLHRLGWCTVGLQQGLRRRPSADVATTAQSDHAHRLPSNTACGSWSCNNSLRQFRWPLRLHRKQAAVRVKRGVLSHEEHCACRLRHSMHGEPRRCCSGAGVRLSAAARQPVAAVLRVRQLGTARAPVATHTVMTWSAACRR